ncbi:MULTISPECIES: hypothetical protein [unclassified Endozoicomonas]|nr:MULTISPECIES: hypothetical protein [unclassified Endozoicomonas]
MQGSSTISAVIQTALHAAASPFAGITAGVRLLTTMVATPGAVAGYLLGKLVSKAIEASVKRFNKNRTMKTRKHLCRIVRVLQTTGTIVGTTLVIMQALSHPLLMALYAAPVVTTAAKQTVRHLIACGSVYRSFKRYGASETLRRTERIASCSTAKPFQEAH